MSTGSTDFYPSTEYEVEFVPAESKRYVTDLKNKIARLEERVQHKQATIDMMRLQEKSYVERLNKAAEEARLDLEELEMADKVIDKARQGLKQEPEKFQKTMRRAVRNFDKWRRERVV